METNRRVVSDGFHQFPLDYVFVHLFLMVSVGFPVSRHFKGFCSGFSWVLLVPTSCLAGFRWFLKVLHLLPWVSVILLNISWWFLLASFGFHQLAYYFRVTFLLELVFIYFCHIGHSFPVVSTCFLRITTYQILTMFPEGFCCYCWLDFWFQMVSVSFW